MEEEKKSHKLLITLIIILVALLGVIGGAGVWYWQQQEMKKQKSDSDKQIQELQKQIDELRAKTTNSATPITTVTKTETETITTFCEGRGSNYKVLSIQHVTNDNGDFALCHIGFTDTPSGLVIYGKKIDNNWTEIFKGQENPSSSLANQYKIPHSLYMFEGLTDTSPDGYQNWKY